MATKVTVLAVPSELRYDHDEILPGGAQFCRLGTLEHLKSYWQHQRINMRYACVGTGYQDPARFLETHEWIFSPSKEALVAAVVRWQEFRIAARWYDMMSDESPIRHHLQSRRVVRRDIRMALNTWSARDEAAYIANSQQGRGRGRHGFWRLANLPCALTHFDWFSEYARFPDDPELPKEHVEALLQRTTFDDWKAHQTLSDVEMLDTVGIDETIAYWERERAEGRDPYEG
jgi:hypothetical protein